MIFKLCGPHRHVACPVSMTENSNLGMGHVTGKYLTIIGDDDAVLPGIVDVVACWASKHQYSAVKAKQLSFYRWPNCPTMRAELCLTEAPLGYMRLFVRNFTSAFL